jgi:Kdo2-lipid IVA lauroyltransferase/acyltransferase
LKNDLIYIIAIFFIKLLNAIPRRFALMLAGVIGEVWYLLDSKSRQMAEQQLSFALKLSPGQAKIQAKACFQLMAKNLVDMVRMGRWSKKYMANIVSIEGYEHYLKANEKGKGIIALTGHIGQFELMAAWFGYVKERKVAVIGRKLYDKRLDELLVAQRAHFNILNIATVSSPLAIMRALADRYAIGILLDQDSSNVQGYFADFYGKKALTAAGPVMIARKTGSPILPMAIYRTNDDKFVIRILPELQFEWTDDRTSDIIRVLTMCNKTLEELINYDPIQWAWIHNRWRHRPPEEKVNVEAN